MKMTESYNPLKKQQDLQTLTNIIVSWNSTRLDLFELTLPNEDLEFSGCFFMTRQDEILTLSPQE